MSNQNKESLEIDDDTLQTIEDRVLREEKEQLSYQQPHNIIPKLIQIVEEEVPEANGMNEGKS